MSHSVSHLVLKNRFQLFLFVLSRPIYVLEIVESAEKETFCLGTGHCLKNVGTYFGIFVDIEPI